MAYPLGWNQDFENIWQNMKAKNHPYWQKVRDKALNNNGGNEIPWRWLYYYYMTTKDPAIPQKIYNRIMEFKTQQVGVDDFRNYVHDWIFCYEALKGVIPADQQTEFYNMIDSKIQFVLDAGVKYNMTPTDSDNIRGTYFTIVLWAIVNEKEGKTARRDYLLNFDKPIAMTGMTLGGLNPTTDGKRTFRNRLVDFAKLSKGGIWFEGSQYSMGLANDFLFVGIINEYYGKDLFPEFTSIYNELIDGAIAELTPDLRDQSKWGDIEEPRGPRAFTRIAYLSGLAHCCKDPARKAAAYGIANKLLPGQISPVPFPYPFINPYAEGSFESHKKNALNASGVGMAFFHSGDGTGGSFFTSKQFNKLLDHQPEEMSSFELYRKGGWAITNPRGYADGNGLLAANTLALWGGVGGKAGTKIEAKGQVAYQADADKGYLYHVGAMGGYLDEENTYTPMATPLDEFIRTHLYFHNPDNSDTVLIFDRLNTTDPRKKSNYTWYDGANRPNGWSVKLPGYKHWIDKTDAKHTQILHIPNSEVAGLAPGVDRMAWECPNGESLICFPYMEKGFTVQVIDEKVQGFPGQYQDSEKKFTIRIQDNDNKDGFRTYATALHVGSAINKPELIVSDTNAPEVAKGLLMREFNRLVLFNATQKPALPKDALWNGGNPNYPAVLAKYQPNKLEDLKKLRYFENWFMVKFTGKMDLKVFICDLNPEKKWKAVVKDKNFDIVVGEGGMGVVSIPSSILDSGENSLAVAEAGMVVEPPPPPTPPPVEEPESAGVTVEDIRDKKMTKLHVRDFLAVKSANLKPELEAEVIKKLGIERFYK